MELKIETPTDAPARLSMILWGDSGSGKTTLAATAPGRKLFLMLDPDGDMSIRNMPNWHRINLSKEGSVEIVKEGMKPDPYTLYNLLADFDTLIVDSLTKFSEHALQYAVRVAPKSTIEQPGLNGYGLRNICVSNFISNTLRITGALNKHVIFITHEKDADRNNDGAIISVGMLLGGQLPNITSKDISEVWNLRDHAGKRYISIRPERFRSPMKSRMFDMTTQTSFEWRYNANTNVGPTIAAWWKDYITGSYNKLPVPK
jgi:AAA domain